MNIIAWDKTTDTAVTPERLPLDLEWSYNKATKTKKQYNAPRAASVLLTEAKQLAVSMVNPEAARRFEAIAYKKERAEEQPELYSLPDTLAERQAIRDASNKAKLDISALTTIEEVEAFTW